MNKQLYAAYEGIRHGTLFACKLSMYLDRFLNALVDHFGSRRI